MASPELRAALDIIAKRGSFPLRETCRREYPALYTDVYGEFDPTEKLLADEAEADRESAGLEAEWR